MPQTEVTLNSAVALDGLAADSGFGNVDSKELWGYSAKFGVAVCFSTDDGNGVDTPVDNSKTIAGITVRGVHDEFLKTKKGAYDQHEVIPVATRGRVWCRLFTGSPDVVAGGKVYAKTQASATFDDAGSITGEDTTADPDNIEVTNARFLSAGSAGDLVVVEINLP